MGIEPPFIYDQPSKYTFANPNQKGFNPKAVSQAAWAPKSSRPKADGPLINSREMNRHPDSYLVVSVTILTVGFQLLTLLTVHTVISIGRG